MLHTCPGRGHNPMVIPEHVPCPHCGRDIEIWRDEKEGRCVACDRQVERQKSMAYAVQISQRQIQSPSGAQTTMAVCEAADFNGQVLYYERYETVVPLSTLHLNKYKASCHACRNDETNLACPPFSPSLQTYTQGMESARLICLRLPLAYFRGEQTTDRESLCFKKVQSFLVRELIAARKAGFTIAGSGPCTACEPCEAKEGPTQCRAPDEHIFSLEALGIDPMALSKHCFGINLESNVPTHSAQFICAMGAVFFQGDAA